MGAVTESVDAGQRREPARRGSADRPWTENRPSSGWLPRLDVGELWTYRELALALAKKDLSVRYKQTFFGIAWALLQPVLAVLIFTVIFGRLARLATDGIPYTVFSYAGMILWLYTSSAVNGAAQSLVGSTDLITKIYFPRLIAPVAAILPGLVDLAIAFLLLVGLMIAFGVGPGAAVVLLPLWVLAAVAVALAVAIPLSALNVRYRDVRVALPLLLQVWLFASPVAYSSSLVEGGWRYVYAINPVATVLDGFRWSLVGGPAPGPEGLVSAAVVLVIGFTGLVYFRHAERSFADVI
jgi:lipopolysaccharide transport system permease protein